MDNMENNIAESNNKVVKNSKFKTWWTNFFKFKKSKNESISLEEANHVINNPLPKSRWKSFWHFVRLPLVVTASLGIICGIAYPIVITGIAQTAFPYEANGSQIKVKVNGEWKVYGSKLIGEDFYTNNDGRYMFGRLNFPGKDYNITQDEVSQKINSLINYYNNYYNISDKFPKNSQNQIVIPEQLITYSGSGVDPTISIDAAEWQIPLIIAARQKLNLANAKNLTEEKIEEYINKYSSSEFAGIYGNSGTNVLLINLALDGIIVD